ncbi:MAG: pirin family protein [Nocardioides sp.]|uniref:pirin family protein n=1 Tax=Nocardioides sp. TaxID=35761 RepID=UPI0039E5C2B0
MTWHSFSFGAHYDPERVGFGPMVVHDEHLLGDGQGFETHHHERVEIVTWMLSGALLHTDRSGPAQILRPGSVGVLSAGSGVDHAEIAAAPQTRFVQVWLSAEDPDRAPRYVARSVAPGAGAFAPVAEPIAGARLSVARLDAGQGVVLPAAARRHLYVATGALTRSSLAEPLAAGDAFEITAEPDSAATPEIEVTAGVPTELLLWTFDAPPGP